MKPTALIAVLCGAVLAVVVFGLKFGATDDARRVGVPTQLQTMLDSRYAGLPTEKKGFAPHGWISVVEQPPTWNPNGAGVSYPICARPEWFPYDTFLGPPVPETAVFIDPAGYMFETEEGIRVHRDGWVVTQDGRAFRAREKINDMGFPQASNNQGD